MAKIAVAQMNSSDQYEENLQLALQMVEDAANEKAEIVAFPETFLFMGGKKVRDEIVDKIPGSLTEPFQKAAKAHQISILLGSVYEKADTSDIKYYNTSVLIDTKGTVVAIYRKIHLYDVDLPTLRIYESDQYLAGDEIVCYDHPVCKIGLTICYDLRFPALFSKLAMKGASLIFVPAAFTLETGKDHWLQLLKARAIENQVYIAAPAQFGQHYGNRSTFGNSVIIDPWGTVLAQAPYKNGLIFADLDFDYLERIRERMPVEKHKVKGIDV